MIKRPPREPPLAVASTVSSTFSPAKYHIATTSRCSAVTVCPTAFFMPRSHFSRHATLLRVHQSLLQPGWHKFALVFDWAASSRLAKVGLSGEARLVLSSVFYLSRKKSCRLFFIFFGKAAALSLFRFKRRAALLYFRAPSKLIRRLRPPRASRRPTRSAAHLLGVAPTRPAFCLFHLLVLIGFA